MAEPMTTLDRLAARIRCTITDHQMTLRWTGGGNDGWTPVRVGQCRRCGAECTSLTYRAYVENHADGECDCPPNPHLLHRDGVPWREAEPHWWWQRCRPQTRGLGVERCSCGAIRVGSGPWLERKWRWR